MRIFICLAALLCTAVAGARLSDGIREPQDFLYVRSGGTLLLLR